MTLDPKTLKNAFGELFRGVGGYPDTPNAAGPVWANLYASYAGAAVAQTTVPVAASLAASAAALGTALATVFDDGSRAGPHVLDTLPAAMAAAFTAFWPSVQFAAPGIAGVAVGLPGDLPRDLGAFFSSGTGSEGALPDPDDQADRLAAILDGWTRTVTVTNTPVSGTPETVTLG